MLSSFLTGLFHKRCPVCKHEVHKESNEAVQRLGRWFCSEQHADLYEIELYEALRTVRCRHVGCHGQHVPLREAVKKDLPHRPTQELLPGREAPERCLPR